MTRNYRPPMDYESFKKASDRIDENYALRFHPNMQVLRCNTSAAMTQAVNTLKKILYLIKNNCQI